MNEAIRMQLSAFVDGELPSNESELLLRRLSQDAELRQEVAQYLALGRLMRSEEGLAATDRLHERVAAELNDEDSPVADIHPAESTAPSKFMRPLAGAAVAATVALVAIFSLQQNAVVDDIADPATLADQATEVSTDVVPEINLQEERQRQYLRSHTRTTSELGANGMNSRVVSLQFSEDVTESDAATEDEESQNVDDVESIDEPVTQP